MPVAHSNPLPPFCLSFALLFLTFLYWVGGRFELVALHCIIMLVGMHSGLALARCIGAVPARGSLRTRLGFNIGAIFIIIFIFIGKLRMAPLRRFVKLL